MRIKKFWGSLHDSASENNGTNIWFCSNLFSSRPWSYAISSLYVPCLPCCPVVLWSTPLTLALGDHVHNTWKTPAVKVFGLVQKLFVKNSQTSVVLGRTTLKTVDFLSTYKNVTTTLLAQTKGSPSPISCYPTRKASWKGASKWWYFSPHSCPASPYPQLRDSLSQRKFLFSSSEEPTPWTPAPHNLYTYRKQEFPVDQDFVTHGELCITSMISLLTPGVPDSLFSCDNWSAGKDWSWISRHTRVKWNPATLSGLPEVKKIFGNVQIQVQDGMSKWLNSTWKILFAHTHLYTYLYTFLAVCRRHPLQ